MQDIGGQGHVVYSIWNMPKVKPAVLLTTMNVFEVDSTRAALSEPGNVFEKFGSGHTNTSQQSCDWTPFVAQLWDP
jgi:hypothetical protein